MSAEVVPFGKYRDQPVEVLLADRNYCQWALSQPGLREKYPDLFDIVLGVGGIRPEDTPEHNIMQMRFLDHREALRLAEPWLPAGAALREKWTRDAARDLTDRQRANLTAGDPRSEVDGLTFEAYGWDVIVTARVSLPIAEVISDLSCECVCDPGRCPVRRAGSGQGNTYVVAPVSTDRPVHEWSEHFDHYRGVRLRHCADGCPATWEDTPYGELRHGRSGRASVLVELKPIVGDDYPSILRDVIRKWRRSAHMVESSGILVLADRAEFTGVSLSQVKAYFATQSVRFMTTAELSPAIACSCDACSTASQTEVRLRRIR